ncbi:glycosyltransferase family 39 protein [Leptothermofonsia sichuanensis E412]|uniref:ArnT family glycosyltransferase n=1 Tax=Leptothermofonsia sichuanensis TaxID=2917832 RepID=UPI001CA7B630|nr:glycosyltransferase family 39 protein [Leptothermofonsia sichuanensis]QZZ23105.1 glycosyltransferase family 39 protein [Leptothermofonsia sichuanensis E412]
MMSDNGRFRFFIPLGTSPPKEWVERLWAGGLLLAALPLFMVNLGGVSLRDWDEGTVAQVAREIYRAEPGSMTWLHPTIFGVPYLNKPPLLHWLIALTYHIGGVNEWTARLPGAILTAVSVPLLYGIGRELFPRRLPAIFAALVYLTLLPVVRHGRLAMLDGASLCFFLLLIYCVLRTRRNLRWGLGAGIAFGLLCLTKGILALLLGAIAVVFILLDTPRLLTSGYVWGGVLLGSFPVFAWYGAQWQHYGDSFISISLGSQSFHRIWIPVEQNTGPPWYYLLEILKYSLPWLLFLPWGGRLVWENRRLSWATLVMLWVAIFLGAISLMKTKLPWYGLPIYPALALAVGAFLGETWNPSDVTGMRQTGRRYPTLWVGLLGLLAIAGWTGSFYYSFGGGEPKPYLPLILTLAALTFTAAAILVRRQDSQFIPVLIWGSYLSLLSLMLSPAWVWELNEQFPVKPVAEMIQQVVPPGQVVMTTFPHTRPSLDFYSDRRVIPTSEEAIKEQWKSAPQAYLLTDAANLAQLGLPATSQAHAEGWTLVAKPAAIE